MLSQLTSEFLCLRADRIAWQRRLAISRCTGKDECHGEGCAPTCDAGIFVGVLGREVDLLVRGNSTLFKKESLTMIGLLFWLSVLFILYVYLGYPLILVSLARLRQKPVDYPAYLPNVTILIAAHNEQAVIASKLENTLALDYPLENLQIIVAADGSEDRTAEVVKSFEPRGVELAYQPERRGKMAAINRAMSRVRHELVLFSDANNLYARETLRELVKPFSDPRVGGVSGSKNILGSGDGLTKADGLYWRYESYIKDQETRLGSCTGVSG